MASTDEKSAIFEASPIKGPEAEGQRKGPHMPGVEDGDERLLNKIGYTQDLSRHFTKWSTLSYAISILGVLGSVPATFGSPLALGVAELVSAYPTAGGMYFVTRNVVPPKHAALWSWIIGWCNLLGQTSGVASVGYTVSQMILAAASMNSGLDGDTYAYSPTPLQIVLLSIALLAIFGIICSLTTHALHSIIIWFAPINIIASVTICIALLILTPNKQSASWVFGHFTNGSGWGTGFSFLLSFLSVAWTMTDYDGTSHMSEETHDAAIRGPQAIRHAVTISGVVGWMLTVTFCFCIPDLDAMISTPTGLPAAQIFLNAGGRQGGTTMWFFVILVQFFTGCSAMLADTRMAYAFARDGALPFSAFFARVNGQTGTPLHAVWLIVAFASCLNLIGIGSTQTIVAIFNITAPALDLSYAAVIFARIVYEYLQLITFVPGPFSLGRMQKPYNVVAIVWVCFISVVLMFPTTRPVTPTNMNYAVVVALGIATFSLGWWWAGARKTYTGPKTRDLLPGERSGNGDGSLDEEVGGSKGLKEDS
ncbi:amino acid permease [Drepanopeziza brunnea f. sp. 'multigermtubi' MB_m1]|uniref:Amino acid permease n=1 Tax=Marssonina brunnea f. sp. multigermtubi (strain MB_m1) TaxID=1072389 RepID=K1X0U0_MARBU|nr:amino acid permease [Drepanopeziza brunnea f. sp. 'multigermtubi' MB_m1]EKD18816.1 amino acid permease [Drepanopeziza brunnea f. sp. 'multigermtubi' MB_m1]